MTILDTVLVKKGIWIKLIKRPDRNTIEVIERLFVTHSPPRKSHAAVAPFLPWSLICLASSTKPKAKRRKVLIESVEAGNKPFVVGENCVLFVADEPLNEDLMPEIFVQCC